MLPSLEPLPSTTIQALRGVVNVVLNDDELEWAGPSHENKTTDMTMVVVRRKGLGIYKVGSRLVLVKVSPQYQQVWDGSNIEQEIPLPSGPISAAISSSYLCAAIPSTNTYSLIDLAEGAMTEVLPVTQIEESELDFVPNANVVVIPGEHEFLVTSFTGSSTMGVFLNGQGDPVRGTMEWEHHPLAISEYTFKSVTDSVSNGFRIHFGITPESFHRCPFTPRSRQAYTDYRARLGIFSFQPLVLSLWDRDS